MNDSFLAEKERGSYNGGGDPFPTARIHVDEDAEQDVLEAAVKGELQWRRKLFRSWLAEDERGSYRRRGGATGERGSYKKIEMQDMPDPAASSQAQATAAASGTT